MELGLEVEGEQLGALGFDDEAVLLGDARSRVGYVLMLLVPFGIAALLAMLNSCASGVTVVNIDNGFGAGYAASQINALAEK